MSFLGFGRQQPSSAEKIAAVEAEMKLMADMMNRYVFPSRGNYLARAHELHPADS